MIRIDIRRNGIDVTGHAPRRPGYDHNDVCTAVSAMTTALLDGLEQVGGMAVDTVADGSGVESARWSETTERGAILVAGYIVGIRGIAGSFPGAIDMTDARSECFT